MPSRRGRIREDFLDLVEQCFDEPHPDEGTDYPCTKGQLRELRSIGPVHYVARISPRKACSELLRFHERPASRRENAALSRIGTALRLLDWGPDLIIKAFHDLDTAFFGGNLAGYTMVRWQSDAEFHQVGVGSSYGVTFTCFNGTEPQKIFLNAEVIFGEGSVGHFKQMWGTMLHEMVHAFYAILCGNVGENHGPFFREAMLSVDRYWRECFRGRKLVNREEEWMTGFD
ncbi:MAG: hypothetical protein Q9205_005866 [Flavoplaca limonia]